jgi:phosphoribosylformimino-5-aminoimidazole carboxamide ribotide isomerase
VIVGSSLFKNGAVDTAFAARLADAVDATRLIAAVDSFEGKVVVRGWRESAGLTAVEAVRALEPYCGEFLYTHVDTEGLMRGTDMEAIRRVREATSRPLTAAGGITTRAEIDFLDQMGVDAVVGMAIYTGLLTLE